MSAVERAIEWALGVARDDAYGYDQTSRWGPDYDCSSFVISAWEAAGVGVRAAGASYTGNMKRAFLACGFALVTDGSLLRGDVLLNERDHTALYLGGGQLVQASINERGTITGGVSGDQTGREIFVRSYYDYPWDCVLRYTAEAPETAPAAPPGRERWRGMPLLSSGSRGEPVKTLQHALMSTGETLPLYGADGDYGAETEAAVRRFQQRQTIETDGVCGNETWEALTKGG